MSYVTGFYSGPESIYRLQQNFLWWMPLCSYIRQQEDNRQAIFAESITLSIDGPESREEKSDANPYDFT
jgi:hypothetical protein